MNTGTPKLSGRSPLCLPCLAIQPLSLTAVQYPTSHGSLVPEVMARGDFSVKVEIILWEEIRKRQDITVNYFLVRPE